MTLVVNIPDEQTPDAVVGEQAIDAPEMGDIAEMLTTEEKLDSFHPGWSAKGKAIAEACEDLEPAKAKFIVVRVEEGDSNNGRRWTPTELASIAEQVNRLEPVGHWGHPNPANQSWEAPDPQTTWIGATTKVEPSKQKDRKGQPVTTFYAAGYNLRRAKVRDYIQARAVRGISWWGRGQEIRIPGTNLVEVKGFVMKHLDWAKKLSEGMPTTSIAAVTSEQEGHAVAELSLAQVTPEQYKKECPNGYTLLVNEATAELSTQIGEMEEKVEVGDAAVKTLGEMRSLLGVGDNGDPIEAVKKLISEQEKIGVDGVEKIVGDILKAKVADEKARRRVNRLLPVAEMYDKVKTEADPEKREKLISEQVEAAFNEDEDIKDIVSEQGGFVMGGTGRESRSRELAGSGSVPAGMTRTVKRL